MAKWLVLASVPAAARSVAHSHSKVAAMKINVNIECTPEEARAFLGLPDVQPLQDSVMKEIEARMLQGLAAMDPETALRTWLPASIQGFEQLQKLFWAAATGTGKGASGDK
jgi:hypothetical protein